MRVTAILRRRELHVSLAIIRGETRVCDAVLSSSSSSSLYPSFSQSEVHGGWIRKRCNFRPCWVIVVWHYKRIFSRFRWSINNFLSLIRTGYMEGTLWLCTAIFYLAGCCKACRVLKEKLVFILLLSHKGVICVKILTIAARRCDVECIYFFITFIEKFNNPGDLGDLHLSPDLVITKRNNGWDARWMYLFCCSETTDICSRSFHASITHFAHLSISCCSCTSNAREYDESI